MGLWLLATTAWAQAPAWTTAAACGVPGTSGISAVYATAGDASGNLFVTGVFTGTASFGTTTLSSQGADDLFIAKYVPATATWAWALRAGGTGNDVGRGLAVSGNTVYLTGSLTNSLANANLVKFESQPGAQGTALISVPGNTPVSSSDLFMAKYTDNGASATLGWTLVGGGTGSDMGTDIVVSGTSLYVVGTLDNNLGNTSQAFFGDSNVTPGRTRQAGASSLQSFDILVAKYTDQGAEAILNWTQVGGGTGNDYGAGIAVSGNRVYVTGALSNTQTNGKAVLFGGSGTTAGTAVQYGTSASIVFDLVVAKYTDNGSSATLGWTQVGGGQGFDEGRDIAVSGNSVYVAGYVANNRANAGAVVFGGSGATAGTSVQLGASTTYAEDLLVAKYTDNGPSATFNWSQVGGGTDFDSGQALVVSGSNVYVAGHATNNSNNSGVVVFGASGLTAGTVLQPGATSTFSLDVVVAKYTDNGPSATFNWSQVGGGTGSDQGVGLAVAGSGLYVGGGVVPVATFGGLSLTAQASGVVGFVAGFASVALAGTPAVAGTAFGLYPNPAPGPATLSGAPAGAAVGIFDALGRCVATATADAHGAATLPGGLRPGLYVVRAGASAVRWVVE
jgi:hypothetical protein